MGLVIHLSITVPKLYLFNWEVLRWSSKKLSRLQNYILLNIYFNNSYITLVVNALNKLFATDTISHLV